MLERRLLPLVLAIAIASLLLSATAAFAAEPPGDTWSSGTSLRAQEGEGGAESGGGHSVRTVVLWTVFGVGTGAVVFTALYMLKRRVGGFPENPEWVAPITIVYSHDLPVEGDYGDVAGHGHGDPHGAHH